MSNATITLSREEIEISAAWVKRNVRGTKLATRLAELRTQWKAASYAGHCDHMTLAPGGTLIVSVRDECVRCGTGRMWQ